MTIRPASLGAVLAMTFWSLHFCAGAESGSFAADRTAAVEAKTHWAFKAPRRPPFPSVRARNWIRNPIDIFAAAAQEDRGLAPAPEADRRVLIRRLCLDLLGLPPTRDEIEQFINDHSASAYENLVNRLLDSPHYGERWGRHWLDLARWAESDGYEANEVRPHAWRYRDYVVHSFNEDKPYDRFLREQIAGDELEPYTDENLIATGFLAGTRVNNNEEDKAVQLNEPLVDIANTVATVTLGLTLGCAQCHDHKFEPLSARDYYAFQGFFIRGQVNSLLLKDEALWKKWELERPPELESAKALRNQLRDPVRERLAKEARAKLARDLTVALNTPSTQRTDEQKELAKKAAKDLEISDEKVRKALSDDDQKLLVELERKISKIEKELNEKKPQTWGFYSPATSPHQIGHLPPRGMYPFQYKPEILKTNRAFVLKRGDIHLPEATIPADVPAILHRGSLFAAESTEANSTSTSASNSRPAMAGDTAARQFATRSGLVDWLTSEASPLTARVWVNYIWQQHFGRGIVGTPADFGTHGARPTHPELLDWLATELPESGWSTKHIQRLIVTSSTYRQASQPSAANERIDPENKYLWRWVPRRLESEAIRDMTLAVSGELDPSIGGPSDDSITNSARRSLYVRQHRLHLPAMLALFDAPIGNESCPLRHVSTVSLQSLHLLNNEQMLKRAEAFAARVSANAGNDCERRINAAFEIALARTPDQAEMVSAKRFFAAYGPLAAAEATGLDTSQATVSSAAGGAEGQTKSEADALRLGATKMDLALVHFCHSLLNLNEFIYIE